MRPYFLRKTWHWGLGPLESYVCSKIARYTIPRRHGDDDDDDDDDVVDDDDDDVCSQAPGPYAAMFNVNFRFDYVYFNLFKPFVFMDENFHPVCASLVGEAFAPSASLQLPFFSQEPYASLLATAGLPQACWRKNLKKKRSHLPHWNCPFSKKLLSFDMKCRDSRHEKGMMRRKIKRLIKRR